MVQFHKLPIGIQIFEEIRLGGYVYVDKTDMVYQIANFSKDTRNIDEYIVE